ncbi:MAG: YaeQ family protein [Pseudomonadales bacterium]
MALKATVYKAELDVADLDRSHYGSHSLTIARHPSETEQRLMLRLLAFALFADDDLAFGGGISSDDEPDLWLRSPSGEILHWIELGLPDERRLRRAAGRARAVTVLAYGQRAIEVWWRREASAVAQLAATSVLAFSDAELSDLAALATRAMKLQCTVQEGRIYLGEGARTVELAPVWLRRA